MNSYEWFITFTNRIGHSIIQTNKQRSLSYHKKLKLHSILTLKSVFFLLLLLNPRANANNQLYLPPLVQTSVFLEATSIKKHLYTVHLQYSLPPLRLQKRLEESMEFHEAIGPSNLKMPSTFLTELVFQLHKFTSYPAKTSNVNDAIRMLISLIVHKN